MPPRLLSAALAAAFALPAVSHAHMGYGGRDFGTFGAAGGATTIANQAVGSGYGWADGSDADWGDAHRTRAFKFTLANATEVTLSFAANATATATSVGGLLPGFSLYSGLFHQSPDPADYDGSAATLQWQADNGHAGKEGALVSMGNIVMGNDAGQLSFLTYLGHVADGSAANYGAAAGINGDGLADGFVSGTFLLGAGSYTVLVGGANYDLQFSETSPYPNYGMSASFSAAPVPEPETYAMLLAGLGLVGAAVRRRVRA